MEHVKKTIGNNKFKKAMYIALMAVMVGWVIFRFAAVASENTRFVFNASRIAADVGMPVETITMAATDGVLYEPLAVKNNRAYVSGNRASHLRSGMRIGDGKIVSVSKNLDLESGMFVVRTSGVDDGLHYAEFTVNGHFVPLYAISDGAVFVSENGVAVARSVLIARQDSENAYIKSGLKDGDIVILSRVHSGDKVKVVK